MKKNAANRCAYTEGRAAQQGRTFGMEGDCGESKCGFTLKFNVGFKRLRLAQL